MSYQFNPPPGWPTPPPGWEPPEGWEPDPSWPVPPSDWEFWIETSSMPTGTDPTQVFGVRPATSHDPLPTGSIPHGSVPPHSVPQGSLPQGSVHQFGGQQPPQGAGGYRDPVGFASTPQGFAPGGYANGGFAGSPGPGGPGGPAPRRTSTGMIVGIGAVVVLLLGLGAFFLVRALSDGGDDPTPTPTTAEPTPTEDPTTDEPTPTEEPTTQEPGEKSPAGTTPVDLGAPYEVREFSGGLEATVTLQEMSWDPQCQNTWASEPDGRYLALRFDVAVADPTASGGAYSLRSFNLGAYSDTAETGITYNTCEPSDPLPQEIQPGATLSGWVVVDVLDGSKWLTYDPNYGIGDHPGAAWLLPN